MIGKRCPTIFQTLFVIGKHIWGEGVHTRPKLAYNHNKFAIPRTPPSWFYHCFGMQEGVYYAKFNFWQYSLVTFLDRTHRRAWNWVKSGFFWIFLFFAKNVLLIKVYFLYNRCVNFRVPSKIFLLKLKLEPTFRDILLVQTCRNLKSAILTTSAVNMILVIKIITN